MAATQHKDNVVVDDEAAISVPDSGDTGEGGKLKMIVQLVKKCLGVKDIANMRLSLPASLLEPIPNLEYWHYLDRPDLFAAISEPEHPFERMLAVVRFAFTKDLKFVHGKVCKPYNSVLGEHFRAHWDVPPVVYPADPSQMPIPLTHTAVTPDSPTAVNISETASIKSGRSSKSARSGFSAFSKGMNSTPATTPPQSVDTSLTAQMSNISLANDNNSERLRVAFLTEQVSHHPPVSAYYASCPKKHVEMFGIDQISAKVSGTTVKVLPGQYNQGIFVNITGGNGNGERYRISHPIASVNGILRGSFYVTVGESTIVTCSGGKPGTKFRAIIEYKEESWLGKAHFLVEGVIHIIHEGETDHEEWTKVKHVPTDRVVAVFDGSWRGHIRWRRVGAALQVVPKQVRPLEKMLPRESRKLWEKVTSNLVKKDYSEATKEKVTIEQRQRDEAAERKKKGTEFVPIFFESDLSEGYSKLTEEGRKAIEEELEIHPPSPCH